MAEPVTYEQMRDIMREFAGNLRPNVSPGGVGGAGISGVLSNLVPSLGLLNTAASNATDGLNAVWKGTANLNTALNATSGVLGQIPGVGQSLSKVVSTVGEAALSTNKNMNDAGKYGANFGNSLSNYDIAVKGARMTQEQYTEMVAKNSTALNGLGSTVNRSQANFLEFSKQLHDSDVIRAMNELGVSADEVNEVALATMVNQKGLDLSSEQAQKKAVASAMDLSLALEENTRITGMSRQSQLDEIKTRNESVVVQASLLHMDAGARDQYNMMVGKFSTLGKSVQDVADEIFTGGIRTKEGAAKFAALGPAGAELEKAVLMQKEARTAQEKADADAAMERAKASVIEYQKTQEFADTVTYGKGGFADAAREQFGQNKEFAAVLAKQQELKNEGKAGATVEEAKASQTKEIRQGMAGLDKEGKPIDSTSVEVAKAMNNANAAIKDQTAGLAVNTGKMIESQEGLKESINSLNENIKRMTPTEAAAFQKNLPELGLEQAKSFIPPSLSNSSAAEMAKPIENPRASGSPTFENFLKGGSDFDGMFEKFSTAGTPAVLHGEELVATKDQMKRLFSKFDISDQISSMQEEIAAKATNIEVKPEEEKLVISDLESIMAPIKEFDPSKITSMIDEISAGGIKSEESAQIFAQLGDLGPQLIDQVSGMFNPSTIFEGFGEELKKSDNLKEKDTEFDLFNEISNLTDQIQMPDFESIVYGVGDQFSDLYTNITGEEKKKIESAEVKTPIIEQNKIADQVKSAVGEIKPPKEEKVSLGSDVFKNIKTSVSSADAPPATPSAHGAPGAQSAATAITSGSSDITLKDVHEILVELNTNMIKMSTHAESISSASSKQVKETKKLSGSRFG